MKTDQKKLAEKALEEALRWSEINDTRYRVPLLTEIDAIWIGR